jgi:hypothetical protein
MKITQPSVAGVNPIITGDLTMTNGDVIISDSTKGVVMNDGSANHRVKVVDEAGNPVLEIENA